MDKRIVANRLTDEEQDFINSGNIDAHDGNARFDATLCLLPFAELSLFKPLCENFALQSSKDFSPRNLVSQVDIVYGKLYPFNIGLRLTSL